MTNPFFVSFEIFEAVLFLLCLRHAMRAGKTAVGGLLAGIIFGLLLEIISIRYARGYSYGQFTLMVFSVPLAIGIAWGNQIYGMRLFSDSTTLPGWARPVLDALLIVYIDLVVDPIAIRLRMWNWRGLGFHEQYFGVPYANFWGFVWLVYAFSVVLRAQALRPGWIWKALTAVAAVVAGLASLLVTILVVVSWLPATAMPFVLVALLSGAVVLLLLLRPRVRKPPDRLGWIILLASQAYFLIIGSAAGVLGQPLALVGVVLLLVSLFAYWRVRTVGGFG